jgi:hypothetical protein
VARAVRCRPDPACGDSDCSVDEVLGEALTEHQFWITTLSFAGCGFTMYMFTAHMPKFAIEPRRHRSHRRLVNGAGGGL